MIINDFHLSFINKTIQLAKIAALHDEVPVGALITKDNKIISSAYNSKERNKISNHHAEMIAIERACQKLNSWRLVGCCLAGHAGRDPQPLKKEGGC